jgi:hypothetical protein
MIIPGQSIHVDTNFLAEASRKIQIARPRRATDNEVVSLKMRANGRWQTFHVGPPTPARLSHHSESRTLLSICVTRVTRHVPSNGDKRVPFRMLET